MRPPLRLRRLTGSDLAFADALRAAAGWNQTPRDWERFLALEPEGCFLAEWEGTPAGTATTLIHGPELAWIGMVLVHPEFRRRGIGSALLRHCLDHLRARGVLCIKLDATPLGQPVYEALGFRPEWTLARWERPGSPTDSAGVVASATDSGGARLPPIHPNQDSDKARQQSRPTEWEALDGAAFGVARTRLCEALVRQGAAVRIANASDGVVAAFGMSREGSRACYLGPVVAASPAEGLALIEALLDELRGEPVFWDIPEPNTAAVGWATEHGLRRQRSLTRMFLGENRRPGDPALQFALAGPEVG